MTQIYMLSKIMILIGYAIVGSTSKTPQLLLLLFHTVIMYVILIYHNKNHIYRRVDINLRPFLLANCSSRRSITCGMSIMKDNSLDSTYNIYTKVLLSRSFRTRAYVTNKTYSHYLSCSELNTGVVTTDNSSNVAM